MVIRFQFAEYAKEDFDVRDEMGLRTQQIRGRLSVISVVSAPNSTSHHAHCSSVSSSSQIEIRIICCPQLPGLPPCSEPMSLSTNESTRKRIGGN